MEKKVKPKENSFINIVEADSCKPTESGKFIRSNPLQMKQRLRKDK